MVHVKDLQVGQYAKQPSTEADKLHCSKCGNETELLYGIPEPTEKEPQKTAKVCKSCFDRFWLEKGYKNA